MRFSVIAVSMFAGAAMAATSTDYVTEEVTITSCAATVTDCPARSTQVSTTIYSRTSSTEAGASSVTPAGQPSNSAPASSAPASSAPASSAPASSAPVVSSPAPSAPASSAPVFTPTYATPASSSAPSAAPTDACAAECYASYNSCRSAPDANRASCASSYASCLGYSPYDSNGSLVTPTACSKSASATGTPAASSTGSNLGVVTSPAASSSAPSAAPTDACVAECNSSYNSCRSAPDANRATCASEYASCLGFSPYDSNGSLVTPTACSKSASATGTPAASTGSNLGVVTSPAPSVSVIAITTCIPTVIYSTVSLSGHETTVPGAPAASAKPSSTGYISVPANGTTPVATQTPLTFTGAASTVQVGGAAIAAVFGLAAFLL